MFKEKFTLLNKPMSIHIKPYKKEKRGRECLPFFFYFFLNLIFLKNRVILQKTSTGRSLEERKNHKTKIPS
jgi:hypothetical protein